MSKGMKIVFTLSMILNVVFIGAAIGMVYNFRQGPGFPGDMSPEARAFMSRTFKDGRSEIAPLIADVKEKRKRVEETIVAPQFDKDSYDRAASDMLDVRDRISRKKADVMGRALVDVPEADRRKYSKIILDGLEGRPKHGKRLGKRHGDAPLSKNGDTPLPKDENLLPMGDDAPKDKDAPSP